MHSTGFTIHRVCTLALLTELVSACVNNPVPEIKQAMPEAWHHAVAKNEAFPTVQNAWWETLQDTKLNAIVQLAMQQNLSLAQAKEHILLSRAMKEEARASEYPNLNLFAGPDNLSRVANSTNAAVSGGSAGGQSSFQSSGAYLAGFDLLWEIPLFGRRDAQRRLANGGVEASEANLKIKEVSLTAEVVNVYGELRAAQERLALYASMLEKLQTMHTMFEKAYQAGLVAKPDLEEFRQQSNTLKKANRLAYVEQESALQRLSVLCGLISPDPTWRETTEESWSLLHHANLSAALPADSIRNRPDVKYAEALVMQASGEVGIAKADLYPRLNIEGALMATGRLASGSRRRTGDITYLAPSIRIPVFDWGMARNVVSEREAKLREAILAYRETVLLAIEETEVALANYQAATEQLDQEEQETTRMQNNAQRSQNAVASGYFSRSDAIKLELKAMEKQMALLDAKADWNKAFAHANKALASMQKQVSP